ncbi:MAG: M48 family metalloprotease [Armatimonadetes bacterium]|nr:M48 family metalloprotease [Armatimonadota bacterium]
MHRGFARLVVPTICLLPCFASADMFKPGIKDQITLGKRAAAQVRKEEKVLKETDPRAIEVKHIGEGLLAHIPADERKKKPFEYSFEVIDSKDLNAFALPGGPIFIYSGLLDKLDTKDQIAGVISHELTHIRNEHWASAYADNQKRRLGLLVILSVLNANETAFNIASVSDALVFELPYSRKHEAEADKVGFELDTASGYNPQGMVDVFEVLKKAGGGGRTTEWISDHPALDSRIQKIQDRIKKEGKSYPNQVPRTR